MRAGRHVRRPAPVALITGAGRGIGRGIGRATAEVFAAEGYPVILAERLPTLGRSAERALRRAGGAAAFLRTDVANPASLERTVAADGLSRGTGRPSTWPS